MPLRVRLQAALTAFAAALLVIFWGAGVSRAWVDVKVDADDVRVSVDRTGQARVGHRIALTVNGNVGLRALDLKGVDADAEPDQEAYVVPLKAAAKNSLA